MDTESSVSVKKSKPPAAVPKETAETKAAVDEKSSKFSTSSNDILDSSESERSLSSSDEDNASQAMANSVFSQEELETFPEFEEATYLPKVGDHVAVFATASGNVESIWFAIVDEIPKSWNSER